MKNGKYTLILPPIEFTGKRYRGRYAYEHTVEFWKKEGRLPRSECVIHHIDGDYRNNKWDNLEEINKGEHARHHLIIEIKHGTDNAYRKKCRCDLCKQWKASSMAKYRNKSKLNP